MKSVDKLLDTIEEYRQKMNELAEEKNLTDPEVVESSQGLDDLLNRYYAVLRVEKG